MQLNKTRITIRERDYVGILDLALRVTRAGGWPLAIALVLGAAPMMLFNSWILSGLRAGATGFARATSAAERQDVNSRGWSAAEPPEIKTVRPMPRSGITITRSARSLRRYAAQLAFRSRPGVALRSTPGYSSCAAPRQRGGNQELCYDRTPSLLRNEVQKRCVDIDGQSQSHPSAADEMYAEVEYVYVKNDFDEPEWQTRYVMLTLLLVFWQIPLASAPATLYLGQRLFSAQPRSGTLVRRFFESLPQLVLYQGVLRPLYIVRPHLGEVILLERNPMLRRGQQLRTDPRHALPAHRAAWEGPDHGRAGGLSTLRRSRALHRGVSGDLLARQLGAGVVGGLLVFAVWGSMAFVRMLFVSQTQWNDVLITFYFPLALWIVVSFFGVVRFLSYLDLRIRREGWEVELLARAERARLARKWRVGSDIS